MQQSKYPKNALSQEFLSHISTPTLKEDISIDNSYATNALIMNDCYLTGKNLMSDNFDDFQVIDAKHDIEENHK